MTGQARYFRHRSTGQWYAGKHVTSGTFSDDGEHDASEIARVLGLAANAIAAVTSNANGPDPRTGILLSEPPAPSDPNAAAIAADKSVVTSFMNAASGTATVAQRDDVIKAVIRYLRRMGQAT